MNYRILSLSFAVSFALASAVTSLAQTQPTASVKIITTFDYDSSTDFTSPLGISNRGTIAGIFALPGNIAAFTRTARGTLSKPIVYTADHTTYATAATGINYTGQICGTISLPNIAHGFFINERVFTIYDVPGSNRTYINGENDGGDFVGEYYIGVGQFAYINLAGVVTDINVAGATYTFAYGINNAGETCGYYYGGISANPEGFYRDAAGNYTTGLLFPGAITTSFNAINDNGIMLGHYSDSTASHGLIFTLSTGYTSFDVPGATDTYAAGINNKGKICGGYTTADGNFHGYIAQLVR